MTKKLILFSTFFCLFIQGPAFPKGVEIHFPSSDNVTVTADLYLSHAENFPFIILFHRAGWSRGEYLSIAPRLLRMGFNVMAVDLRSGGRINAVLNKTMLSAAKKGRRRDFLDAEKDMISSINYARRHFAKGKLILWGSSYSASLVIKIVGEDPNVCQGALVFSPGEYFVRLGMADDFVSRKAVNIKIPIFFTSESSERRRWWKIYQNIPSRKKTYFLPEEGGAHGSQALWPETANSRRYWKAVETFLSTFLPKSSNPKMPADPKPGRQKQHPMRKEKMP